MVKPMYDQLAMDLTQRGSQLVSLLPDRNGSWWTTLTTAIFNSEPGLELRKRLLAECHSHGELRSLSFDGTFKICFAVLGQASFMERPRFRAKQAIPEKDAKYRVLTIRGITSAVIANELVRDESAAEISRVVNELLTSEQRAQVEHVATDTPSPALLKQLGKALPNLSFVSLDSLHLAMRYEDANGRRRTTGSHWLRLALARFSNVDGKLAPDAWGTAYEGEAVSANSEESVMLGHIQHGTWRESSASDCLEALTASAHLPYYSREEFVRVVAAIATMHAEEADRVAYKQTKVRHLLLSACQPANIEWMLNFTRFLHTLSADSRRLLPSGTTSNEAYHHELNGRFRSVQKLHVSTLKSRLNVMCTQKLLTHNAALYRPTTRQEAPRAVLARTLGAAKLFNAASWRQWCTECDQPCAAREEAIRDRKRLREWKATVDDDVLCRKRPAGQYILKRPSGERVLVLKKPATDLTDDRHRTVFTIKRNTRLWKTG